MRERSEGEVRGSEERREERWKEVAIVHLLVHVLFCLSLSPETVVFW